MKTSSKPRGIYIFLDFLFFVLLVILDQITKNLAVLHLKDKPAIVIWDGVFELHYLENSGAAFGMLQNQKILFVTIAAVILRKIHSYPFLQYDRQFEVQSCHCSPRKY